MPKSNVNVLVIEDDALQARIIRKWFEPYGTRYRLFSAKTVEEAHGLLKNENIDVIVSDIYLPDGKGSEFINKYPNIPVIIITAQGSEKTAVQIMKSGAADYIVKDSDEYKDLPKKVDDALATRDSYVVPNNVSRLQSHLPTILDTMLDGVVVVDLNGEIVYANTSAETILELQRNGILGTYYFDKKWNNIDENGDPLGEKELPLYRALKTEREVSHVEHGLRSPKTGEVTWISVNAVPMYDSSGSLIGALATFRDITPTKEMQREIKRGQRLISAIEHTSDTLLILLDYEGRIIRFNRACEELTGYSFSELEGKKFWEYLIPKPERKDVKEIFSDLRDNVQANQFQNNWITKDGGSRFIAWSNTTVRDEKGGFEYVLGTGIDITERKRDEERRIREIKNELVALEQFAFKNTTSVTADTYGQRALKAGNSEEFRKSVDSFSKILDEKIDELTYKQKSGYSKKLQLFADNLGILKAKPKDVIDIYTRVLENKLQEAKPAKNKVYRDEGRLLVLELMGYLASFYRKYYTGRITEEGS